MEDTQSIAFLTACDQKYAAHAKLLMTSLVKQHPSVPRYLAILGKWFSEPWFDSLNVETFKIHSTGEFAFYKPLCIAACPAQRVIWFDADTCVVRPLPDFFFESEEFIVFEDSFAQAGIIQNPHELYELAPVPQPVDPSCLPNSGVIVTSATDPILFAWCEMAQNALSNEAVRAQVRYWDQGCLIWALHKQGKINIVINDNRFNYPANGFDNWGEFQRKKYDLEAEDVLLQIENDHPDAHIVHWMGGTKLHKLTLTT